MINYIWETENLIKEIDSIIENELKILNDKIREYNNEIILINSIREDLWDLIVKTTSFLENKGNIEKINYEDFKLEKTHEIENNELTGKKTDLEYLRRDMRKNKVDYDKKTGFFKVMTGRLNTRERRDLEATNYAQNRLYKYLEFFINLYKNNLKIRGSYYDDCIKIVKEYRSSIKNLVETVKNNGDKFEIFNFLQIALSIKKEFELGEITENSSYKEFELKTVSFLETDKYERYRNFVENILYLKEAIEQVFVENTIGKLVSLEKEIKYESLYDKYDGQIHVPKDSSFFSLDWVYSIDNSEEKELYSVRNLKIRDYSVLEEKSEELKNKLKNETKTIDENIESMNSYKEKSEFLDDVDIFDNISEDENIKEKELIEYVEVID